MTILFLALSMAALMMAATVQAGLTNRPAPEPVKAKHNRYR